MQLRARFDDSERFADLLPSYVAAEQTSQEVGEDALLAEERVFVARAVASRRSEFTAVRHCARLALAHLGHHAVPILPGIDRDPQWPGGIVGSHTHCVGLRAAAVAFERLTRAVGIDAEPNQPLPSGVLELICSETERLHLVKLRRQASTVCWDRLLFSAKESIFKAWFPLMRTWLDFTDCELFIDPRARTFVGLLRSGRDGVEPAGLAALRGQWALSGTHLLTAVCVPQEP